MVGRTDKGDGRRMEPPDTRRLGGLCIGIRLVIDAVLARRAEEEHCIAFFTCTAEAVHALGIRISLFFTQALVPLSLAFRSDSFTQARLLDIPSVHIRGAASGIRLDKGLNWN